jgi:hypothetical protein
MSYLGYKLVRENARALHSIEFIILVFKILTPLVRIPRSLEVHHRHTYVFHFAKRLDCCTVLAYCSVYGHSQCAAPGAQAFH